MIEARLDSFEGREPLAEIAAANESMTDGASAFGEFRAESVAFVESLAAMLRLPAAMTEVLPPFYESTTQSGGDVDAKPESVTFTEARTDSLAVLAGQHWNEVLSEFLPLGSLNIQDWPEARTEPFYLAELGDESMPTAHSAPEVVFTAANGATATQADSGARAAPATRFRVRLINTSPTYRVYVATSQADAQTATAEVIEADFGVWEADADANVSLWVRPGLDRDGNAASSPITVRMRQYATA